MKLTTKLVVVFGVANIVLAGIYGYFSVQREVQVFRHAAEDEARSLGDAVQAMLSSPLPANNPETVASLVRRTLGKHHRMQIQWVWFDAQPGEEGRPAAPPELLRTMDVEHHLTLEILDADGTPHLNIYWPVAVNAPRRGGLEFSCTLEDLQQSKREIIGRTAMLIGGMTLISGCLAMLVGVHLVGDPLRTLIAKTRRVADGDLSGPVHLGTRDELAELAESLNRMCQQLAESQARVRDETAGRIAAMEQLRHADRLKTVGRLAAGIAHELGTPLNVVSGRAGLIASGKLSEEEILQSAVAIKTESERMTRIIRQLLDFARRSTPHKAPVDLRQLAERSLGLLVPLAEKRNVQLRVSGGEERVVAEVDAGQIQQVLTNLVVNAVQAMPEGGPVEIAVGRRRGRPPVDAGPTETTYACIDVRDRGVGISEEHIQQLFEPFFTTKEVGEGTGLGLSIAYGIVQEHGGWIDVASQPGQGSCFTIYLPEETPQ